MQLQCVGRVGKLKINVGSLQRARPSEQRRQHPSAGLWGGAGGGGQGIFLGGERNKTLASAAGAQGCLQKGWGSRIPSPTQSFSQGPLSPTAPSMLCPCVPLTALSSVNWCPWIMLRVLDGIILGVISSTSVSSIQQALNKQSGMNE